MTDFLNFDLCKTSELVSSGELSAAELTKASIDRAEAFQPKLNSFKEPQSPGLNILANSVCV